MAVSNTQKDQPFIPRSSKGSQVKEGGGGRKSAHLTFEGWGEGGAEGGQVEDGGGWQL